jgi:hypothetical protein
MGLGLVTGFTELLQNITTNIYSANTNSDTLQFNIGHMKSSQSAVFTGSSLVMASSAIASLASVFMSLLASGLSANKTGTDQTENTFPTVLLMLLHIAFTCTASIVAYYESVA